MNRRSERPILAAALVLGVSYTVAAWAQWQGPMIIAWKGAGVALLAVWVARQCSRRDGRAMAVVLGFGALGDVLLAISLSAGAVAFLVGHLVATSVYARHRGRAPWAGLLGSALTAAAGYALSGSPPVALYAATLGLMVGSAVASTLPRRIGIGAMLFMLSDLLIFARLGPLADSWVPTLLVWPLYFAGQALIASGAVMAFGQSRSGAPSGKK